MSYITVSAEKVAIAAQTVIDRIMQYRQKEDEEKITNILNRKFYRLFFFQRMALTREQAIDYLNNYSSNYITWRSCYAWGAMEEAKALLIMAQNGDPVNISNDDAELLWG